MLNEQDVLHVASLSRLNLKKDEIEKYKDQLSSVLDLFKKIEDLNVDEVEETSQVTGLVNVTRADEVRPDGDVNDISKEDLLANVPNKDSHSIVVPKVIEDR
jgi:aspartyl-tRNA(Asn)/glutamyl-tRNA(Gln) amidotransferase subunit C